MLQDQEQDEIFGCGGSNDVIALFVTLPEVTTRN